MTDTLKERLFPPKCTNLHDWITLWCFISAGLLLGVWLLSMLLAPTYTDAIFKVFLVVGGFAVGRVSIIIVPGGEVRR